MFTKAMIAQRMRRKNVLTRVRSCGEHTVTTREFLSKPDRYTDEPMDRCPRCITGKMLVKRMNNKGLRQLARYTPKVDSLVYEVYGAQARTRQCDVCEYKFTTYEVEYPLRKREIHIPYCDECGKPSAVKRQGNMY